MGTVKFPKPNWPKLKASTWALLSFFLVNISLTQVEQARDFIVPKLVHYPKLAGIVLSLFGIAILLHRPQVQKFIEQASTGHPLIPAEPGAQIDDVKVVTKE